MLIKPADIEAINNQNIDNKNRRILHKSENQRINNFESIDNNRRNTFQSKDNSFFNNINVNSFIIKDNTLNQIKRKNQKEINANLNRYNYSINSLRNSNSNINSSVFNLNENISINISHNRNCNNENIINSNYNDNKKDIARSKIKIIPGKKAEINRNISPKKDTNYSKNQYILSPIPETNSIKKITADPCNEVAISLKFSSNYSFAGFLPGCSYCNCEINKCLYVSGGIEQNSSKIQSNILLCIDISKPDDYKVIQKASMNYARSSHSMVSYKKYIYAVGGVNSNFAERYDINNNKWEILPEMINKRARPILHIYGDYLYAFFGKDINKENPCAIERLNIRENMGNNKFFWEIVEFFNANNIDLRCYGSAVHQINDKLFFFGGNCNGEITEKIFYYDFSSKYITLENSLTTWKESFIENKLFQLGERFVQCGENNYLGIYVNLHL